jgi:hypothetical protein
MLASFQTHLRVDAGLEEHKPELDIGPQQSFTESFMESFWTNDDGFGSGSRRNSDGL